MYMLRYPQPQNGENNIWISGLLYGVSDWYV